MRRPWDVDNGRLYKQPKNGSGGGASPGVARLEIMVDNISVPEPRVIQAFIYQTARPGSVQTWMHVYAEWSRGVHLQGSFGNENRAEAVDSEEMDKLRFCSRRLAVDEDCISRQAVSTSCDQRRCTCTQTWPIRAFRLIQTGKGRRR
jgi:hypothetical protein